MSCSIGLDLGASLTKAVLLDGDTLVEDAHLPSGDSAALEAWLAGRDEPVFATGAGARALAARHSATLVPEFEAWGAGEAVLLAKAALEVPFPHLLVSLGTGTSIFRVEAPGRAVRVGGTALGGGTLAGLSSLLSGPSTHAERAALAARGDRSRVDLFVRDLYPHDDIPLAKDLTAANFGKALSRDPADLALALAHLVGENVGLLAGSLARDLDAPRAIVYAGSTLEGHDALVNAVFRATCTAGATPLLLPLGGLTGAVGAVCYARSSPR